MFVVYRKDDMSEFIGRFKTLKEAKNCIKECKRFDKENGNPFEESYIIIREKGENVWNI